MPSRTGPYGPDRASPWRRPRGAIVGELLVFAGCVVALGVVFMALPPFSFGVWHQSEPVSVALHGAAAFVALGFAVALIAGDRRAARCLFHPLVVMPALIGVWGALALPFVEAPSVSWLGTPETGEGLVWYLDLAALVAGGLLVIRRRALSRVLACFAVLVAIAVTGLTVYGGTGWPWAPYWFPDHLAYYGICVPFLVVLYFRPRRPSAGVVAALLGLAIVGLSRNNIAILLYGLAAPILWLLLLRLRGNPGASRYLAVAIVVGVPTAVVLSTSVAGTMLPETTFWSRMLLLRSAVAALADEPAILWFGAGWGQFGDLLVANAAHESVDFFVTGASGPTWDAVARFDFHSHNGFAEALISAGLPGFALVWGMLLVLVLRTRARRLADAAIFAMLLVGVGSFWFQLPGSLPFVALVFAGLARAIRPWKRPQAWRSVGLPVAAAAAVVHAAATATAARDSSLAFRDFGGAAVAYRLAAAPNDPLAGGECAVPSGYTDRTAIHAGRLAMQFATQLAAGAADHSPAAADLANLAWQLCALDRLVDRGAGLRTHFASLLVRAELAHAAGASGRDCAPPAYLARWRERLERFFDRAPLRADVGVPYLVCAMQAGEEGAALAVAERLLAHNADDPVGLWFSGAVLLERPDGVDEGMARLRRALATGIDRFLPVDDTLRAQVLSASDPPGEN